MAFYKDDEKIAQKFKLLIFPQIVSIELGCLLSAGIFNEKENYFCKSF
jgi:hypothetical protein